MGESVMDLDKTKIKALKAAFPVTIPVMLGYLFVGMAFGMLFENKGYGVGWALFMSVFVYAGSMQFVAIGFFAGGIGLLSIALMTFMVNFRHTFYGLSFIEKFKSMGNMKPYMIFSLTDETFSLLCSAKVPNGVDKNLMFFYISLLDQIYWIIGSVIGSVAGTLLTFNTKGIDFAMIALFVVIFVEQWRTSPSRMPALIGIACAVLCLFLAGPQSMAVISMLLIAGVLLTLRSFIEKSKRRNESL